LKVCPLDDAKQRLEELRKLDPKAIEQAEALSLFGTKLRPVPTSTPNSEPKIR
jgi:hypothetical protein